jgi:3-oxoacyl-(acyl-carrier-protein) synthase
VSAARQDVCVTGRGAVCALGDQPQTILDALCEGQRRFAPPTLFAADIAPGVDVAEVRDFAPQNYLKTGNIRPLDRTGRLALVGVELALVDSGWSPDVRAARALGLILGTMFCSVKTIAEFDRRALEAGPEYASPMDFSNTVLNAAAGQAAIWEKLRGVNTTIATGATSGLYAIGYGAQLIQRGRADALVTGGAEEVCYESFYGFLKAGRLASANGRAATLAPFDAGRNGTLMGEGAAFLVLETAASAQSRNAAVLARVLGVGSAYDPHTHEPNAADAGALASAIRSALASAGISGGEIGLVAASASGSRVLDAREAAGISAVLGADVPVTAIKSMTGEALGASGALQTLFAIESLKAGRVPGIVGLLERDPEIPLNIAAHTRPLEATRALVTSVSPEGNCCALIVAID